MYYLCITCVFTCVFEDHSLVIHPAESSENTAICAKIRKFGRGFEELLPVEILDQ